MGALPQRRELRCEVLDDVLGDLMEVRVGASFPQVDRDQIAVLQESLDAHRAGGDALQLFPQYDAFR